MKPPIEVFGDGESGLFLGDCAEIMQAIMDGRQADLIYVDPPFATGRRFARRLRRSEGRPQDVGIAFDDGVTDIAAYTALLAPMLERCRQALAPTGSFVLHVDPRSSHYLKVELDRLFGFGCFRSEIVWCYGGGGTTRRGFPPKHDVLLWYSRSQEWTYHEERKPYKENTQAVGKHSTYARHVAIDLARGTPVTDWWTDIPTETGWGRQVDYPTAKPRALLRRIMRCLSNPGDLVVDPMMGSGTTVLVAREEGRAALGIDKSPLALVTARSRLISGGIGYALHGALPTGDFKSWRRESPGITLEDTDGLEAWAVGGGNPFRAALHSVRHGRQGVGDHLGPLTGDETTLLLTYGDGRLVFQPLS